MSLGQNVSTLVSMAFLLTNTFTVAPSIDECTLDNGGCEHACIPASVTNSSSRRCTCNPGFQLSADDEASCKGSLILCGSKFN